MSSPYGEPAIIVSIPAMSRAAEQVKYGASIRVLLMLPHYLSFTEFRRVPSTKLGQELGCGQSSVSAAMRDLQSIGLVERQGRGPHTMWRLTEAFGMEATEENIRLAFGEDEEDEDL